MLISIIEKTCISLYDVIYMVENNKYHININDQNVGPLCFEEIAERIKNGLLNAEDYIFVMGQKEWQTIKELPEFDQYLEPEDPTLRKVWFIRKNRQNEGPYSKKEILDMVESGSADINDYVWGKELRNWTTIKDTFMIGEENKILEPVIKETEPEPKESIKEISVPPIKEEKKEDSPKHKRPKVSNKMLPEFILGVVLIALGLYKSSSSLTTALVISLVGIVLLLLSLNGNKEPQGE